ncbi:MAG: DUF4013 domain-containing protein [Chloroflexi bacterium]|nr:DUF4013 domain-containing protein [Chloroflexota bacterium]
MTQVFTSDTVKELLIYPFQDEKWKQKLSVAGLISIVGLIIPVIPGIFFIGYCAQIMKRIILENGEPYLPEWDDWSQLFHDGWKLFAAGFVYMLPVGLILIAGYALMMIPMILAILQSGGGDSFEQAMISAQFTGMMGGFVLMSVAMLVMLVVGLLYPVAAGHVVAKDRFAAAFHIREWWPIFRANLGGFLISYALVLGVYFALSFITQFLYMTIVLCIFVPFVAVAVGVYITLIGAVLFAQAYRVGCEQRAPQAEEA